MSASRSASRFILHLVVSLALSACLTPLISPYNQRSYEYATTLKQDSLAVMDLATEPYGMHEAEASALMRRLDEAHGFVSSLPKNEDSAEQWRILKARDRDLLGGFMRRWQEEGSLSRAFIRNAKQDTVGPAFDAIIELEASKRR